MHQRKIILVTGGQRSGKSEFAERLALENSERPIYIATSQVTDDPDFCQRIEAHRKRRGTRWHTIEEPLRPDKIKCDGQTVLIDCVTLWATNVFFSCGENKFRTVAELKKSFEIFTRQNAIFIFVSNEVGLGGVSGDALTRNFADVQGDINKIIAHVADEVWFVVSGIPMRLK